MPTSMNELLNELERILNGVALLKAADAVKLLCVSSLVIGPLYTTPLPMQEISTQTRDRIVSFGERLSVRAFSAAFTHSKGEEDSGHGTSSRQHGLSIHTLSSVMQAELISFHYTNM